MGSRQPTNGETRPISPTKLSHAVFRTTRLAEMVEWYKAVLNAEVLYESEFLVFMTYDEEHHRIALAAVPGLTEKPKRSAGLDHLAFFYASFADWITTYERLKAAGITPRVPIHHGLTMSLYYRDPDDNGVELSIDNVEKAMWHSWMRDRLKENPMGIALDPDELARQYHAGVPESELRRFEAGPRKLDPEIMRRMLD
ncbi:MAG: VOC family protein [Candidatus Binataceae bacterium]